MSSRVSIGGIGAILDFGEDKTTQIYRNLATSDVIFTTVSTPRLVISANGNLLVGTITESSVDNNTAFAMPDARLYVRGAKTAASTTDIIFRGGLEGNNNGKVKIWLANDASYSSYIQSEHTGGGNTQLTFGTANGNFLPDERMRIGNNGNVSIGGSVTAASFFGDGTGLTGLLLTSNDTNLSNYVLSTSNILVNRISAEVGFGSNYSNKVGVWGSNYSDKVGVWGSNYSDKVGVWGSNYSDKVGVWGSNYSNKVGVWGSNYSDKVGVWGSNYSDKVGVWGSNYSDKVGVWGSNYARDKIGIYSSNYSEKVGVWGSNYSDKVGVRGSNYSDKVGVWGSNYSDKVGVWGSNYARDKIGIYSSNYSEKVGIWGSNYSDKVGVWGSNYARDNIGIYSSNYSDKVSVWGSNYVARLESNASNYVLSTSNIFVNKIDSVSSKWTTTAAGIYYNSSNVGIGTSFPDSKLHIYNDTTNATKLTIQNNTLPTTITSTPVATTTGITDNYTYMVLTYTTETAGIGSGQTLYTINVPSGGLICDILMVGGGGAGGIDYGAGGGGGAVLYGTNIMIESGIYNLKVGKGDTPAVISGSSPPQGEFRGKSTEGFGATILGGGSAGNWVFDAPTYANSGGSGSGYKLYSAGGGGVGISTKGSILTNAILYNGNLGGYGQFAPEGGIYGGGGGGAGGVGTASGNGGVGVLIDILDIDYYWGGGGGGGSGYNTAKSGGLGGGGAGMDSGNSGETYGIVGGSSFTLPTLINAGQHTGGGGGGGGGGRIAGNGGSGIIIIRYLVSSSASIELLRNSITDNNTDYKIGNYNGNFKIISSASGINRDRLEITTNGNVVVGGNVAAKSFVGNGSRLSGLLLTSNDANISNYVLSTSNILVDRIRTEVGFGSNYTARLDVNISNYVLSTSNILVDRTRTEVGFGSNYTARLDSNASNYVLSSSNALVTLIMSGVSSQWTNTDEGIYYNSNIEIAGNIKVEGDIIPSSNSVYNLGSLSNRWKDLYLSGNSIFIDDLVISKDTNSNLNIKDEKGDYKSINVDSIQINNNNKILKIGIDETGNIIYNSSNKTYYPVTTTNIENTELISDVNSIISDTSNYVIEASNILVNKIGTEVGFGSNYVAMLDSYVSNYVLSTSNILVNRIGTGGTGSQDSNASNYIVSTSNILVNQINSEVGFGSNYVTRLDSYVSNYVLSTSNILVNSIGAEVGFGSNYIVSTSNILVNSIGTEVGFGSNYVARLDSNVSNYIVSTSNILVNQISSEVGFGSNYVARLDVNISNYILSTSNILVNRIGSEVGFGSNYIRRLDSNVSNYIVSTSNILVDRMRTEVGFGSNYLVRLNSNASNYIVSTSNILVNRIISTTYWNASNACIYYNSNVGIGTINPQFNLDIQGTNPTIRILDTNSNGNAIIALKEFNDTIGFDIAYIGNTDNKLYIRGYNASSTPTTHLTIVRGTGNVGIRTETPVVALHVVGDIVATGSVTAYYSDERLKTKLSNIIEPLKIIDKLNGFYYKPNELAQSCGIMNTEKEIGLSAQDVQKVLPELINIAPFDLSRDEQGNKISKSGENYLTVSYERLAPVFVEAIKELNRYNEILKKDNEILKKDNIELNGKYNMLFEDITLIKKNLKLI